MQSNLIDDANNDYVRSRKEFENEDTDYDDDVDFDHDDDHYDDDVNEDNGKINLHLKNEVEESNVNNQTDAVIVFESNHKYIFFLFFYIFVSICSIIV